MTMNTKAALQAASRNAKRTRRGPHTRQQILDASLRLFSERGFARTTVRDIARQAGITDAAIYYHFESKQELLEALVEERGFLNSLQNLARLQADAPLKETLHWVARGAINIMDQNRDFLRLIIMEGLGGDEAALEQYNRLVGLWEDALTAVLRRYQDKGELPSNSYGTVARHIIYTILMTFRESLIGRNVSPSAQAEERRAALSEFLTPALDHILQGLPQNS